MTVKELKEDLEKFDDNLEIKLINWSNMETQECYGIETDDAAKNDEIVYISYK